MVPVIARQLYAIPIQVNGRFQEDPSFRKKKDDAQQGKYKSAGKINRCTNADHQDAHESEADHLHQPEQVIISSRSIQFFSEKTIEKRKAGNEQKRNDRKKILIS